MWMWNIDRNWRGMRREVPWLRRPPFADVREHVRFSTAPFDADLPEELAHFVRWLGSEELIMFATDYPHLHDDDVAVLLEAVPESMRPKVMADNARGWYRL
jgi:predicted TIM-barrel fold metal-dependent hydrolase